MQAKGDKGQPATASPTSGGSPVIGDANPGVADPRTHARFERCARCSGEGGL
jgi:hypothetical protein